MPIVLSSEQTKLVLRTCPAIHVSTPQRCLGTHACCCVIHKSQATEAAEMPIDRWMYKEDCCIYIIFVGKEKWDYDIFKKMAGTGDHCNK